MCGVRASVLVSTWCCGPDIHGFGCFMREDVKKDDFLTEYRGEIISQSESNRRGKLYDKVNCTYLFDRNQDYVLDGMRKGNLIKFANHAPGHTAAMYPRIRFVNAEHRHVCHLLLDVLPFFRC